MQRPRITTDDADRIAQKSHELIERTIVCDGVSFTTGQFDRRDQTIFTGAIIQNATQSEATTDFLAEGAVAFRRPAFRAPAARGAQDDVLLNGKASQELQHEHFLNRRHRERDGPDADPGGRALCQLSILIGDVLLCAPDAIGVEDSDTKLTYRLRGTPDPSRHPAKD